MQILGMEWSGCRTPVSKEMVDLAQDVLGVVFPASYRDCLTRCGGGRPIASSFSLVDPEIGQMESCIGALLALEENDPEGLLQTNSALEGRIPPAVVAIADDGGGGFVCLDYRAGSPPGVGYWTYDLDDVIALSPSFEEFLGKLH